MRCINRVAICAALALASSCMAEESGDAGGASFEGGSTSGFDFPSSSYAGGSTEISSGTKSSSGGVDGQSDADEQDEVQGVSSGSAESDQTGAEEDVNRPPAGGAALLSPSEVAEGDMLTCKASGAYDLDGDEITWTYSWFVSGVEVPSQYMDTLSSAYFDKGDEVWCVAVPHDWASAGPSVNSKNNALVVNTVPSVEAAHLTPSETVSTGTFNCSFSGWYDPDPVDEPKFEYAWELENGLVLSGHKEASLSASLVTPGQSVRCVVTPYDDESFGEPVASPLGAVVFDGPKCEAVSQQFNLNVQELPPSILMVVDRSGSMYDSWGVTKAAVGQVLADLGPDAETGLVLYPSGSSCSIADEPQVPLGAGQAEAIVAAMSQAGVGGATPMGRAMKSARMYLETSGSSNTTVVLAADGKPSDTCLEDCTGCDCTDASVCLWCADLMQCTYNEVRKEVEALHDMGIKTFVIGYEGGFGATGFLESLAISGGTAEVGDSPFYDAADGSALGSALTDIAESIKQCEVQVAVPGYYESVQVKVGNVSIDNDVANGYQLSSNGVLTLNGEACSTALSSTVTVQFNCGD